MDLVEFRKRYEHKEVIEEPNSVSSQPLVSVCVQTYQHVDFIKECLDSILMQKTNFEFEILLGDDASTDGTREICEEYSKKFPDKIRLFLHYRENNIAIGGSPTGRFIFITNLLTARGKYIALCEGDDYWTDPYKLQKQVDFLEKNPEYVITHHDAKVIDDEGKLIKENKLPESCKKDFSESELKKGAFLLTLSLCFRNTVQDFPEEGFKVSNGDTFLISLLGNFGKGKYLENIKPAVYREHSGGVWSKVESLKKLEMRLRLFDALSYYYKEEQDLLSFYRKRKQGVMRQLMLRNVQQNKFENFKELAIQYSKLKRGENKINIYIFLIKIYVYYCYTKLKLQMS